MLHTAHAFGCDFPLLDATIDTNEEQPKRFIAKIHAALGGEDLTARPSACSAWRSSPTPTTCARPSRWT